MAEELMAGTTSFLRLFSTGTGVGRAIQCGGPTHKNGEEERECLGLRAAEPIFF